jgi:hypothetical protein
MLVYATLLRERDELIEIIKVLITLVKIKATQAGIVYDSIQHLVDCRAQVIVTRSKINFLLFVEHWKKSSLTVVCFTALITRL